MGIYATKTRWQRMVEPLVGVAVRHNVHPDTFTIAALALSFLAALGLALAGDRRAWLWLVPPCAILRLVLNLMDGQVARSLNLAGAWGEAKNEFSDRVADAAIFLGLAWGGYADARLAAVVLALVLGASYLGTLGKALGGSRLYGGVFGKGDRMITLAIFTLYPLLTGNLAGYNWYLAAAAVLGTATVAQRWRSIHERHA